MQYGLHGSPEMGHPSGYGCGQTRTWVLILVWDENPQPPARMDVTEDAESGRGLLLVEVISDSWNWYRPHGMDGKIVWAQVSRKPPDEMPRRVPRKHSRGTGS
jgi:hypothetical protein